MKSLAELRERIDRLDDELIRLLNERASVAAGIGRLKQEHRLPVYVPEREESLLSRLASINPGPLPEAGLRAIYREIMSASRALEDHLPVVCVGEETSPVLWVAKERLGSSLEYRLRRTVGEGVSDLIEGRASCLVLSESDWKNFETTRPADAERCVRLLDVPESPMAAGSGCHVIVGLASGGNPGSSAA